jgi:hypothetical protein
MTIERLSPEDATYNLVDAARRQALMWSEEPVRYDSYDNDSTGQERTDTNPDKLVHDLGMQAITDMMPKLS